MCIGFPGQVTALDERGATVRTLDRERRASTLLMPEVVVGDWVYVAVGTIVERLDPADAAEVSRMLNEAASLA